MSMSIITGYSDNSELFVMRVKLKSILAGFALKVLVASWIIFTRQRLHKGMLYITVLVCCYCIQLIAVRVLSDASE